MRESRLFALATSAIFAALCYYFVWTIYPSCSWCKLGPAIRWIGLVIFSGPLLFLLWSVIPYRRFNTYILFRRLVMAHAFASGAVVILSLVGLAGMIYGLFGAVALAADGLVIVLSPPSKAPQHVISYYARSVALGSGAAVFGLIAWSLFNAAFVVWQASTLAKGRPFCLQVASDYLGQYKEVKSLHDLTGLRMQTPFTNGGGSEDFQFAFHGVLVIADTATLQYFNWSYKRLRFEPISDWTLRSLYLLRPSCSPRQHFADQLAWVSRD